jgi:hypothetical protein
MPDDLATLLIAVHSVYNRQQHRFLLDVLRTMQQSPTVTLAEMESLWDTATMPRPPDLVWQALVQMATLAWRAALAVEAGPCVPPR